MDIRTLKYFLAVVKEGSISNAAKALGVAQPTLSRQLSALEDELGRRLYTRTHRGIVLTEQGVVFNRYASSIVSLADKAESEISMPEGTISGNVGIASAAPAAMDAIVCAMARVQEKYPQVTFDIASGSSTDLMDGLVRERYDVLVTSDLRAHSDMNVLGIPGTDALGVLVPAGSMFAEHAQAAPEDLDGHALIAGPEGLPVAVRDWAHGLIDADHVLECSDMLVAKLMASRGLGCLLASERLAETGCFEGLVFRPLAPKLAVQYGVVWRKTMPSPQAQVFIDEVKDLCAQAEQGSS